MYSNGKPLIRTSKFLVYRKPQVPGTIQSVRHSFLCSPYISYTLKLVKKSSTKFPDRFLYPVYHSRLYLLYIGCIILIIEDVNLIEG